MNLLVILAIPLLAASFSKALLAEPPSPRDGHGPRCDRRLGAGRRLGPEGRLGPASRWHCQLARLGRLRRFGAAGGCRRGHYRGDCSRWGIWAGGTMPYSRTGSYYLHFNLFLFSLLLVPMSSEPMLAWVAIELTALVLGAAGGLRQYARGFGGGLEIHCHDVHGRRHCPARVLHPLHGRSRRAGAAPYTWDVAAHDGSPHAAGAGRKCVLVDFGRPGRKGWVGAAAHLAARRAQPGAVARLRDALGRQNHDRPCRDPAVGAVVPGTSAFSRGCWRSD